MERERSKKLRALQVVFNRPWWQVALEWAQLPHNQTEVASRWTAAVSGQFPNVIFRQQEVARIFKRAADYAAAHSDPSSSPDPAAEPAGV